MLQTTANSSSVVSRDMACISLPDRPTVQFQKLLVNAGPAISSYLNVRVAPYAGRIGNYQSMTVWFIDKSKREISHGRDHATAIVCKPIDILTCESIPVMNAANNDHRFLMLENGTEQN